MRQQIEAHGTMPPRAKRWRIVFDNAREMRAWCEANHAQIDGWRLLEVDQVEVDDGDANEPDA